MLESEKVSCRTRGAEPRRARLAIAFALMSWLITGPGVLACRTPTDAAAPAIADDPTLRADPARSPGRTTPAAPGRSDHEAGSPVLRVGTSGDYPPFSDWPKGQAEPRGFSIDVARAFARSQRAVIEWVRFEWPGLERDLVAGRFDLVLSGVTVRPDRSITGRFALPLTSSGLVVLVPEHSAMRWSSDLDRPSTRLAVNAGGHLERTIRRLLPEARIEPVPDNRRVLDRLPPAGHGAAIGGTVVDGVVTDSIEAPVWLARRPDLRPIGPLTHDLKAAWLPATADGEARARALDAWLLAAEREGLLDRMRAAHGLPDAQTARPLAALLSALDERLSLMERVAHAKWLAGLPIEDAPREDRVLEAARAATHEAATRAGLPALDPVAVDAFFRAQIEAAKWIQHRALGRAARLEATPDLERDEGRIDLERRIRPALIFLGERLARLLVATAVAGGDPPDDAAVEAALARHALPQPLLHDIAESLRELLRVEARAARPPRPRPEAADRAASA